MHIVVAIDQVLVDVSRTDPRLVGAEEEAFPGSALVHDALRLLQHRFLAVEEDLDHGDAAFQDLLGADLLLGLDDIVVVHMKDAAVLANVVEVLPHLRPADLL